MVIYQAKYPSKLILIRHGESESNLLLQKMRRDPEYQDFIKNYYNADPSSRKLQRMAQRLKKRYETHNPDYLNPLSKRGASQALQTGKRLKEIIDLPGVVFTSPYKRALHTLDYMADGWSELKTLALNDVIIDDALREQEFGDAEEYSNFEIFFALNEKDRLLYTADKDAPYYYRFPRGESLIDLKARTDNWFERMSTECAGETVMVVSHNLAFSVLRARIEGWDLRRLMDEYNKMPMMHNCGITIYENQDWLKGLVLDTLNLKLWKDD